MRGAFWAAIQVVLYPSLFMAGKVSFLNWQVTLDQDPAYMHKLADKDKAMRAASVESDARLHVGFEGSFGHHLVSPRGLSAAFVTQLVAVEGIVTKCSIVRPKVVRSVHYCPSTVRLQHFLTPINRSSPGHCSL